MFNDSVGAINTQVFPLFARFFPFLDGVLDSLEDKSYLDKNSTLIMMQMVWLPLYLRLDSRYSSVDSKRLVEAAYIDDGANVKVKFLTSLSQWFWLLGPNLDQSIHLQLQQLLLCTSLMVVVLVVSEVECWFNWYLDLMDLPVGQLVQLLNNLWQLKLPRLFPIIVISISDRIQRNQARIWYGDV